MMRLAIREVAERRGVKNAYQLQKALEVPPSVAARLWKSEMRMIGLDTLDLLCSRLKCKPNDLLKFEPDK
jgi:DNA-binding Xre family transcriptional regulator